MWFIGVEVEQEMSAHPPKKNPGSAPDHATPREAAKGQQYEWMETSPVFILEHVFAPLAHFYTSSHK